jgi:hypothetical protein
MTFESGMKSHAIFIFIRTANQTISPISSASGHNLPSEIATSNLAANAFQGSAPCSIFMRNLDLILELNDYSTRKAGDRLVFLAPR